MTRTFFIIALLAMLTQNIAILFIFLKNTSDKTQDNIFDEVPNMENNAHRR